MMNAQDILIYPGSFDPCTNGHIDLICRGAKVTKHLIVAVANNPKKTATFTVDERKQFLEQSIKEHQLTNVSVDSFNGLLVDYANKVKAKAVLRGLRAMSDFEFEFQLAHMNKRLAPALETLFMMTGEDHFYVSSRLVKEISSFNGDISSVVPAHVSKALVAKFG